MKFLSLLLTLFFSFKILASEIWITNKTKLPSEFGYLLESIQKSDFTPNEQNSLSSSLKELDNDFSKLNKEELFLLIKGEIYKALLTNYKNADESVFDKEQVDALKKQLNQKGPQLNAFALWLMIAIKTDAEMIINHPDFIKLKLGIKNAEQLRLKKKSILLAPWISHFTTKNIDEFHSEMHPLLWKIFSNIENATRLFIANGKRQSPLVDNKKLSFFLKTEKEIETFPELENWLRRESLKNDPTKIKSQATGWTPKNEIQPSNLPKALPKPIDDWGEQSDWSNMEKSLLKVPENQKNEKQALPRPINDWILDE